jgi:hypothetical protein
VTGGFARCFPRVLDSTKKNNGTSSITFLPTPSSTTTAMENLATGVGPVKRERTEIVPVNNQGTSLPRKKFFRARAHCNPLSDSTFPV